MCIDHVYGHVYAHGISVAVTFLFTVLSSIPTPPLCGLELGEC